MDRGLVASDDAVVVLLAGGVDVGGLLLARVLLAAGLLIGGPACGSLEGRDTLLGVLYPPSASQQALKLKLKLKQAEKVDDDVPLWPRPRCGTT